MKAISELSYKGGNTRTGAGLRYVADNFFGTNQIRPDVPKVRRLFFKKKKDGICQNTRVVLGFLSVRLWQCCEAEVLTIIDLG